MRSVNKILILASINVCIFLCPLINYSADLSTINADLIADIKKSQQELSRTEIEIVNARRALSEKLNSAQNAVQKLRKQTVAARRLADEQTLSLNKLEERIRVWREQNRYQGRLLSGFSEQTRNQLSDPILAEDDLSAGLKWLEQYIPGQQASLSPQWQEHQIVLPDGRIDQAEQLKLGPVTWFWRPQAAQGGIIDNDSGLAKVSLVFPEKNSQEMAEVYLNGQGLLTFDPTLSRALRLAVEEETFVQHLEKGGIWIIPILLFALFASTIAIVKAITLWRLPKLIPALADRVGNIVRDGRKDMSSFRAQLQGPQADLIDIILKVKSSEQRDDRLFACLLEHKNRLERWLGAIAVTAAVSPLLGLLGTVSGMITTFKLMTLFGAGDPSSVSAGISEALVTTEMGLIVAIPALLAHALMTRKVKSYFGQLESDAVQLSRIDFQV